MNVSTASPSGGVPLAIVENDVDAHGFEFAALRAGCCTHEMREYAVYWGRVRAEEDASTYCGSSRVFDSVRILVSGRAAMRCCPVCCPPALDGCRLGRLRVLFCRRSRRWPREESNLRPQIRSLLLYPLSYGASLGTVARARRSRATRRARLRGDLASAPRERARRSGRTASPSPARAPQGHPPDRAAAGRDEARSSRSMRRRRR